MEPITAASVIQFLAPFTPYLIKVASTGGKKFVETIAEKGGEATWNKAQDIWQKIQSKFGKDKKLQGTINLLRECQRSWVNKVHNVCGIIWKALFMKLPTVESKNK